MDRRACQGSAPQAWRRIGMVSARCRDWPRAAEALANVVPFARLHPEVRRWTEGRSRAAREKWAIALSGGADSLALLLLVWAHWPGRRSRLAALHFNHRLRGAESGRDARFCRAVCRSLGVEFHTGAWKRPATPGRGASEAQAREARFVFFREQQRHTGARALWLGHQKDDIAESLLMRLARGSGTAGLAAPRPLQNWGADWIHVRPLLGLSKAEIETALETCAIPWRSDSSNIKADFLRNRIRHHVLPEWIKAVAGRDALSGAMRSRELLQEDDDALERWADDLKALRGCRVDLSRLAGVPRAVVRRVLQRWRLTLGERAGDLSRQGFEALLAAVERGVPTRMSLGPRGFACIENFRLSYCEKVTKSRS